MFADTPDPEAVRDAARDILGGDEFHESQGLIERFFSWLADHLTFRVGSGGGPGLIGDLITLALIVGAVALIVKVVTSSRRPVMPRVAGDQIDIEVDRRRSAAEWAVEADRLEGAGRYRDAVRARYRELVARLIEHGVIPDLDGRTTGETLRDVVSARPATEHSFSGATDRFERVWYGGRSASEADVDEMKRLAASVLRAAGEAVLVS